jgi:hypothetical protein
VTFRLWPQLEPGDFRFVDVHSEAGFLNRVYAPIANRYWFPDDVIHQVAIGNTQSPGDSADRRRHRQSGSIRHTRFPQLA